MRATGIEGLAQMVPAERPRTRAEERDTAARSHRLLVVDPEDANAMPLGVISTADIVAAMAAPGSVWL